MKKLAIIDDEKDSRQFLNTLVDEYFPNVFVVEEAYSIASGLTLISSFKPDIILLDIHLEDGSSLDLIYKLKTIDFELIFVTAYDKYALRAFEFSAIGYLLKPIDEIAFIKTLEKAIKIAEKPYKNEDMQSKLSQYFTALETSMRQDGQIFIPDSSGFVSINTKDIIRIQGNGSYSDLFLANGQKVVSSFNLSWFENHLEKYRFFRISKSHLINLNHLSRYSKTEGGVVYMSDNTPLTVSSQRKEMFRIVLNLPSGQ
jgi:two-component system LytT family response regulator